jgi:ankyrin repeat protein
MDIVEQRRIREWTLLALVGLMAAMANMPQRFLDLIGMERGLVLAVLGIVVVIALFLYVRFFFFLLYALLAVGANLPDQWAEALHINTAPLLFALVSMVLISLLNYSIKALPTGLDRPQRKQNPDAIQVLINAIDRANPAYVRTVLRMEFDVNMFGAAGHTPLMRAAQRGDAIIVGLLLEYGADPTMAGDGGSPADLARAAGHAALAARLDEAVAAKQDKLETRSDPANVAAIG